MIRFKGLLSLGVAAIALVATEASAVPSVSGSVDGPDNTFLITLSFVNTSTAGEQISSLVINGSTGTLFPILWDEAGTITSPAGATTNVVGVDTQVLTLTFGPDGWDPGETLSLVGMDPDGDPGPLGLEAGQLVGTTVVATFSGGIVQTFQFVEDPTPDAGLVLRPVLAAAVPEPASAMLGLLGVAGLMLRRRRMA